MALELDHLTIIAPTLADGVAHVRTCLGIDMPYGGAHPEMGTHNHLLRLGDDTFLELVAIDPAARPPARPRWFGLDDRDAVGSAWDDDRRLRGWVARTRDLNAVLSTHGEFLGHKKRVSRGDRSWLFAVRPDGALPADGALPSVMDWGDRGCPAPTLPDLGAKLLAFVLEHPDPVEVIQLYQALGVANPPEVRKGAQIRYRAVIATPAGTRELY